MKIVRGRKYQILSPDGTKLFVDIYPVGLLSEIQHSRRYKRLWIRPKRVFIHLLTAIRYFFKAEWKLSYEEWRPFKSYFNGYLAEPDIFPGKLTRCGSGWTRKRALRDLQRRVKKSLPASADVTGGFLNTGGVCVSGAENMKGREWIRIR